MTLANNNAGALPAGGARARWPRLLLIIVAAIELVGGLRDLPVLFVGENIPGPGLGGAVLVAKLVLQPILAFAALAFAIRGRMTDALLAMAGIIALTWLSFLPAVAVHGLGLKGAEIGYVAALLLFQVFLAPIIAVAVALLALAHRWTPACLLAVLPTFLGVVSVLVFAVGVVIYGF